MTTAIDGQHSAAARLQSAEQALKAAHAALRAALEQARSAASELVQATREINESSSPSDAQASARGIGAMVALAHRMTESAAAPADEASVLLGGMIAERALAEAERLRQWGGAEPVLPFQGAQVRSV